MTGGTNNNVVTVYDIAICPTSLTMQDGTVVDWERLAAAYQQALRPGEKLRALRLGRRQGDEYATAWVDNERCDDAAEEFLSRVDWSDESLYV